MSDGLPPVEEEIRRYTSDKDFYGLREIIRHLDRRGYKFEEWYIIRKLNELCQEGHSVFLGGHESNALYQRMS